MIDYNQTLAGLPDVLRRPTDRVLPVVYVAAPPELTTEEANQLGILEVTGEFTTSDSPPTRGTTSAGPPSRSTGRSSDPAKRSA